MKAAIRISLAARCGAMALAWMVAGCDQSPSATNQTNAPTPPTETWFEEIASNVGIDFTFHSGFRTRHYFPECISGGAALIDFDNDGLLDIYLVQAGYIADPPETRPTNRLFRNNSDANGLSFIDVTEHSGADDRGYGMGVATGDYDNDGFTDLYVTNLGPNVLFRNNVAESVFGAKPRATASPVFTNVTEQAGVGDPGFGASAAFLDFDLDGDLDLFVVNYVEWSVETEKFCTNAEGKEEYCSPLAFPPTADVLYRNNGDGTFTDVSNETGISALTGNGLGLVCADFNGDARPDIYVANDGTPNRMWINLGADDDGVWRFEDRALDLGVAVDDDTVAKAGMGVDTADIDNDLDLDILVVNQLLQSDSFHRNEGPYFTDMTLAIGIAATTRKFTRFGAGFIDFDNDGLLDLFEANGDIIDREPYWDGQPYLQPNLLWRGEHNGRFRELQPRGGTHPPLVKTGRAACFGDLDNDGGIDILIVNRDGPAHLLRNIAPNRGHWFIARMVDEHGRDAIGATVHFTIGERTIRRDVRTAYSYLAANDPRVHIGLGDAARVDEITIIWPDGTRERFGPHPADMIVTLRRGEGV
jgi:hypothetical protein